MTAFSNAYVTTSPADTDQAKLYASKLRDFKVDVKERLTVDHSMVTDSLDGKHKRVSLIVQSGNPTADDAADGQLFCKAVANAAAATITELFWDDNTNGVKQITFDGVFGAQPLTGAAVPDAVDGEFVGQRYWDSLNSSWSTCSVVGSPGTWITDIPGKTIAMYAGDPTTIPTGWLLCDGTSSTPNLKGRFIAGYDAGDTDYDGVDPVGSPETGGEKNVTLDTTMIPSHSHVQRVRNNSGNNGTFNEGGNDSNNLQDSTDSTKTTGGGLSHENRPPWHVLAYIMKMPA